MKLSPKFFRPISCVGLLALAAFPRATADKHEHKDHDKKTEGHHEHAHVIKAPNGGRILHEIVPHAEFFVTKERKVQITFVDDDGKPLADGATLRAIGGKRTSPTNFTFKKTKHGLISEEKLPEGELVPIVLMFTDSEGKRTRPVQFSVNMAECSTCDSLEYACICHDCEHCAHGHGEHGGHNEDHGHKQEPAKK